MLATALFACGTAVTNTGVTGGSTSGVSGSGFPDLSLFLGAMAIYTVGIAIAILAVIVIAFRAGSPKPVPMTVPVGAPLSPDGLYWWDGASWRPTR